MDGTAQSHVDLDDPTHLEFEYIRRIGHLIDHCAPPYAPLRALHLGGGAWTLARYVATTRPGSTQTVVELDGPLAEFVAHRLPADGMGIDVTVGDARAALAVNRGPARSTWSSSTCSRAPAPRPTSPRRSSPRSSRARWRRAVPTPRTSPTAVPRLAFAGTQVAAARDAFRHVAVVAPPDVLRGRRFGNLVLTASSARLPVDDLRRSTAADPFPARLLAATSTGSPRRPAPTAAVPLRRGRGPAGFLAAVGGSASTGRTRAGRQRSQRPPGREDRGRMAGSA